MALFEKFSSVMKINECEVEIHIILIVCKENNAMHSPTDTRMLRFTPTVVKLVSGEVPNGRYSADAQEAVPIRLAWAGHIERLRVSVTHVSLICTPILSP